MASGRKAAPAAVIGRPTLALEAGIRRLQAMKARLDTVGAKGGLPADEESTIRFALETDLRDALGENHPDIDSITSAGPGHSIFLGDGDESDWARTRAERVRAMATMLGERIAHMQRNLAETAPPPAQAVRAIEPTALQRVELLISRFHAIVLELRVRHAQRPTLAIDDEYDVQDLFRGMLRVFFDDVRPEEWTPSYAGGASRIDFLLKDESLAIELKKTRDGLGAREVGDQLLIDIARYRAAHPDCKTLVCFVYDPEHRIRNPAGLERDLSRTDAAGAVRMIIVPKL